MGGATNGMTPVLLSPPDVGERERAALLRAFDGGWIAPLGPEVDAFERELADYVGAPACAALSSGSAALELGLLAVGVAPGDEVVVQTATFAASAFAIVHVGATPVFCDVETTTWGLDPNLLESFLQERAESNTLPAAVMAVDLYGLLANYDDLRDICRRFEVPLVEDAAESLGSRNGSAMGGSYGDVAAFSFNGNKIITTSGGGALVGSTETVDRVRYLATQARQPVPHFEHHEIGFNYRLSNLLAALGRAQLEGLEPKIERRLEIQARYHRELPDIDWLTSSATDRPNGWLSVGLLPESLDPAEVCHQLSAFAIEARQTFKPMHAQQVFSSAQLLGGRIADTLFARGLCLPSGSNLAEEDLERVIKAMNDLLARSGAVGPGTTTSESETAQR